MTTFSGYAGTLNTVILTTGSTGTALGVDGSFPCSVNVFDHGTLNLSSIFTATGAVKANPFFSGIDGSFSFVGASSTYDLVFSAAGTQVASTAATIITLAAGSPLAASLGGTGLGTYTTGDLLVASSTTALAKVSDVAAGSYLRSAGVGVAPAWSALTLPNAATQGDLVVGTAANALGSVADVATGSVLTSGGVGSVPAWSVSPTVTNMTVTTALAVGTNTATVGAVRLANGTNNGLIARNATNNGDLTVIYMNNGNQIQLGDTNVGAILVPAGVPFISSDAILATKYTKVSTPGVFATVPGSPVEGMLYAVTDSSTAVWGATITGGGANHVLAYYNGTNWTVAGK